MTTTTPWPRHYGDRLLRLAKFLEKLPRRKFDFAELVADTEKRHGKDCGTVCCAVGWTPAVFPKLISWSRILSEGGTILVGRDLFGGQGGIVDREFVNAAAETKFPDGVAADPRARRRRTR